MRRKPGGGRTFGAAAALMAAVLVMTAGCARPLSVPDPCRVFACDEGGIVRADTSTKRLALIFTGGSFADGGDHIRAVLRKRGLRAAFFFTGDFYRTPEFAPLIRGLAADGHYIGPHSDRHLLYCEWADRARTLVTRDAFRKDLLANYREMERFGIARKEAPYFIPPYEWYNTDIAGWSRELGLTLLNFTPGTSSNADYTTPDMKEYLSSEVIFRRILDYEKSDPHGLNGFILLIHIGTDPARTDKLYVKLGDLIDEIVRRGYEFVRLDTLLEKGGISKR